MMPRKIMPVATGRGEKTLGGSMAKNPDLKVKNDHKK